eukprot:1742455-Pyramimonas_sp.AAC.1
MEGVTFAHSKSEDFLGSQGWGSCGRFLVVGPMREPRIARRGIAHYVTKTTAPRISHDRAALHY